MLLTISTTHRPATIGLRMILKIAEKSGFLMRETAVVCSISPFYGMFKAMRLDVSGMSESICEEMPQIIATRIRLCEDYYIGMLGSVVKRSIWEMSVEPDNHLAKRRQRWR